MILLTLSDICYKIFRVSYVYWLVKAVNVLGKWQGTKTARFRIAALCCCTRVNTLAIDLIK